MLYAKNLPGAERMLRVLGGIALIVWGLVGMKGSGLGYVLAASGVVAALTGFVGLCPMCALAGRRVVQPTKKQRGERTP